VQGDSGRQDPLNWGHDDYPLMTKVLANSEWKEKYKGYLRELCAQGGLFYWSNSDTRIKAWQATIKDYVSNDTGEDMAIKDRPAGWGNHYEYRIMDTGSSNNYFKVKASSVAAMK
jgi:Tfp pilus assembly protein PilX